IKGLDDEKDVSTRRALLLILGEVGPAQLAPAEREPLLARVSRLYREDPDAGIHAAAEWLLRHWGEQDRLKQAEKTPGSERDKGKNWYVNGQGQTMVVIPGPVDFRMGSPQTEAGRPTGKE